MAEEHELRRVNWTELFSFTHIFKSWKLATHFSKLILGVAMITLLFCAGWCMDGIWGWFGQRVWPQEITQHFVKSDEGFDQWKKEQESARLTKAAALLSRAQAERLSLANYPVASLPSPQFADAFNEDWRRLVIERDKDLKPKGPDEILNAARSNKTSVSSLISQARQYHSDEIDRIEDILKVAADNARKRLDMKAADKDEALAKVDRSDIMARQYITAMKVAFRNQVRDIEGDPIFESFADYETKCISNAISAILCGNFTGGMTAYQAAATASRAQAVPPAPSAANGDLGAPRPINDTPGFLCCVLLAVQGFSWLLTEHWVFALVYLAFALSVWALLGGAIYRLAALQATREEKMSTLQALKFSMGKFASFVTAPLLPLIIIFVCGLALVVGGALLGTWGGGILLGLLFVIALALGFVIAFLLVGLVGGAFLMYPTIAVEGSDSFDAISRSFTYVLNKPWRSILYAVVAMIYGALTYMLVRLFIFLTLISAHMFLKWGVFTGGQALGPGADKLDVIWAAPSFDNLWSTFNWDAMTRLEHAGAFLIGVWVFLAASLVAAYLISYFASSSTIIYLLLRRKVDATDLDDVYVDEFEESPAAAVTVKPAAAPVEAAESPASPSPTTPPAPAAPTDQPPQA